MQHYDLASELAAARQALGITLLEISHRTNIQLESLQRLESGCYDFLPPFYIRQIVRKYAEALNLPAETLRAYLAALDEHFFSSVQCTSGTASVAAFVAILRRVVGASGFAFLPHAAGYLWSVYLGSCCRRILLFFTLV